MIQQINHYNLEYDITQVYYIERQVTCKTIASDKANTGKNFGKIYIHQTKKKKQMSLKKNKKSQQSLGDNKMSLCDSYKLDLRVNH